MYSRLLSRNSLKHFFNRLAGNVEFEYKAFMPQRDWIINKQFFVYFWISLFFVLLMWNKIDHLINYAPNTFIVVSDACLAIFLLFWANFIQIRGCTTHCLYVSLSRFFLWIFFSVAYLGQTRKICVTAMPFTVCMCGPLTSAGFFFCSSFHSCIFSIMHHHFTTLSIFTECEIINAKIRELKERTNMCKR